MPNLAWAKSVLNPSEGLKSFESTFNSFSLLHFFLSFFSPSFFVPLLALICFALLWFALFLLFSFGLSFFFHSFFLSFLLLFLFLSLFFCGNLGVWFQSPRITLLRTNMISTQYDMIRYDCICLKLIEYVWTEKNASEAEKRPFGSIAERIRVGRIASAKPLSSFFPWSPLSASDPPGGCEENMESMENSNLWQFYGNSMAILWNLSIWRGSTARRPRQTATQLERPQPSDASCHWRTPPIARAMGQVWHGLSGAMWSHLLSILWID